MSKIRGKNTTLEVKGWLLLREAGIRFRKHPKAILGNPDAANKSKKIAVFFDSEFWHGHDWKRSKNLIKSNRNFWVAKIERNMERDKEVNRALRKTHWTVVRLWEQQMRHPKKSRTVKRLGKIWGNLSQ